ncbi:Dync2i2 [Symbiodinium pilosum]|uniref:Dync2i2 protein n=1 Tax=Symbiodinium pilosum TaxID=2952 RepID=A0A812IQ64_SYMPI|nr:Dync2i2 [Symbiodinium pilosum]
MDSPKQEHPSARFADDEIDGINVRSAVPDRPFYKVVQDKDGLTYAQGVRLQTDKVERANRRLQSLEAKEIEIQTENVADSTETEALADEAVLAEFLRAVAPTMEQELLLAWHTLPVFESYVPVWDDVAETCEMTHQVWKEGLVDLQVTSVAWNSTGATLACAYGRLDTLGWCNVTAPVCVWNIFRPQLVAGEPDTVIQVQGFVMCVAFHPTKPSVLAGGTYNGELQIWNTGAGELDPSLGNES